MNNIRNRFTSGLTLENRITSSNNMKLAIAALLAGSAAAFAPVSNKAPSTSALKSYEDELGVIAPTGFFDPAGLSSDIDQETFDAYRVSELKHGRVCMLAVIGYIVPEVFRWPGEIAPGLAFADIPNGVAAIDAIPSLGWAQMIFAIGATDYYGFLGDFDAGKKEDTGYELNELQVRTVLCSAVFLFSCPGSQISLTLFRISSLIITAWTSCHARCSRASPSRLPELGVARIRRTRQPHHRPPLPLQLSLAVYTPLMNKAGSKYTQ